MSHRPKFLWILTVASIVATLSLGAGASAVASPAPGPPDPASGDRARTCVVPAAGVLQGERVDVAKKLIRKAGCRGIIIVRSKCRPVADFGLVVKPSPNPRGEVSVNQRITLWRGIRQTDDEMICGELPDNTSEVGVSAYDGSYTAIFQPTGSQGPSAAAVIAMLQFMVFSVSAGQITGDVVGSVNADGLTTALTVHGLFQCSSASGVRFTPEGTVSGSLACSQGDNAIQGTVTGNR